MNSPGDIQVFAPRPSYGWVWLLVVAMLFLLTLLPVPLAGDDVPPVILVANIVLGLGLSLPFLLLAAWWPTMRYTLEEEALTLRYGPILCYRVPLSSIHRMQRRNLSLSLGLNLCLPGVALFTVPYSDVGMVRMCATAATYGILLIETDGPSYGITPADEQAFVAAVQARIKS